jgi:hypothetical protein
MSSHAYCYKDLVITIDPPPTPITRYMHISIPVEDARDIADRYKRNSYGISPTPGEIALRKLVEAINKLPRG